MGIINKVYRIIYGESMWNVAPIANISRDQHAQSVVFTTRCAKVARSRPDVSALERAMRQLHESRSPADIYLERVERHVARTCGRTYIDGGEKD